MNGRLRDDGTGPHLYQPGDYGRWNGHWNGRTPNGHLCNLGAHDVVVHDDGTITVSPSILVSDGRGPLWHGYLEHGVWRSC